MMKMNCIICNMVSGKENNYLVAEQDDFFAFLDHKPLFKGHTLISPKNHFATIYELPTVMVGNYFNFVQTIGRAVEKAMEADGSFIAMNNIVSQSIPHFHTHIIPRKKGDGLKGFFWPRIKYQDENEIKQILEKIRMNLL